jgi:hypothetical protein
MTTIDFITALLAPCTNGVISGNKAGQIFCLTGLHRQFRRISADFSGSTRLNLRESAGSCRSQQFRLRR